jgi:hypothetical protein
MRLNLISRPTSRFFVARGRGLKRQWQMRVLHDDGTSHVASIHRTEEDAKAACEYAQSLVRTIGEFLAEWDAKLERQIRIGYRQPDGTMFRLPLALPEPQKEEVG